MRETERPALVAGPANNHVYLLGVNELFASEDGGRTYAVVPGPGLLNTGAALLTAYGMNAPVLALIG